jgi:hypothetical protein
MEKVVSEQEAAMDAQSFMAAMNNPALRARGGARSATRT